MTKDDIQLLYEYDRWANNRVLRAVSTLSAEQFTRDLGGSFRSVRDTLVHIIGGERGWLAYWKEPSHSSTFLTDLRERRDALFNPDAFPSLGRNQKYTHGEVGSIMIARHWRGWTAAEGADAYERLLKDKVLPSLRDIEGYKGGYILRSDGPRDVEFVIINLFDSLEAVKRFAGPDYSLPVFEPEARRLLCKIEPVAMHYEVRASAV
jgi:hypothetical protein